MEWLEGLKSYFFHCFILWIPVPHIPQAAQVNVAVLLQDGLLLEGNNNKQVKEGHMVGKGNVAGIPELDLQVAADMYKRAGKWFLLGLLLLFPFACVCVCVLRVMVVF